MSKIQDLVESIRPSLELGLRRAQEDGVCLKIDLLFASDQGDSFVSHDLIVDASIPTGRIFDALLGHFCHTAPEHNGSDTSRTTESRVVDVLARKLEHKPGANASGVVRVSLMPKQEERRKEADEAIPIYCAVSRILAPPLYEVRTSDHDLWGRGDSPEQALEGARVEIAPYISGAQVETLHVYELRPVMRQEIDSRNSMSLIAPREDHE